MKYHFKIVSNFHPIVTEYDSKDHRRLPIDNEELALLVGKRRLQEMHTSKEINRSNYEVKVYETIE